MAVLPNTSIETHPTGTTGVNGILNGNWERLDALFDPALSSGDAGYLSIQKAFLRSTLSGTATGAVIWWAGTKFAVRAADAAVTYAGTTNLDLQGAAQQRIALTGDVTITTSNRAAGVALRVILQADGTPRNLTWPAWRWVGGTSPASLAASKVAVLELWARGSADTDIVARWSVEP
jgi:hypothetical protein